MKRAPSIDPKANFQPTPAPSKLKLPGGGEALSKKSALAWALAGVAIGLFAFVTLQLIFPLM